MHVGVLARGGRGAAHLLLDFSGSLLLLLVKRLAQIWTLINALIRGILAS